MKSTRYIPIAGVAIALISTILIFLSTKEISQTHDEAGHIAAGLEWFQGSYELSPQNPPLSRIGAAVVPYLEGIRIEIPEGFFENYWSFGGASGLAQKSMKATGDYRHQLFLARLGVLPFFLISLVLVYLLGRHIAGPVAGGISVMVLATTAVVMAHSGLATTDVPAMTTYLLAIYLLILWTEKPTWTTSFWLGVGLAFAICTKFTAIAFITPVILIFFLLHWRHQNSGKSLKTYLSTFAVSVLVSMLVVWAVYQFSIGRIDAIPNDSFIRVDECYKNDPLVSTMATWTVPAPEFFKGILDTWCANKNPLTGYLFEEVKPTGTWQFYPVAFFFKTSLAMLLLFGIAIYLFFNKRIRDWRITGLIFSVLLIFALSMFSHQNIGLRHIIHVYPLITIVVGTLITLGLQQFEARTKRIAQVVVGLLIVVQAAGAFASWPFMLSFFNPLAGDEPGKIIVDSDLYWGQGMYQLEDYFADKQVDTLTIAIFHTFDFCEYDLPPIKFLYPEDRTKGWVAIDEFTYRQIPNWIMNDPCNAGAFSLFDTPYEKRYAWLREYKPKAIVGGNAIRVYYIE